MDEEYDGIVLGAGHNGLILQAYMGLAGLKVLCLERSATAGGGLRTEEDGRLPGFLHNTHSFYHRGLTGMPWYAELGLEELGAAYIEPELNVALLRRDGEALEWWSDFERTAASFERLNGRDARTLRRWRERFLPVVEDILQPEAQAPPLPPAARRARLEASPEGRLLLEVSRLSPLEFVRREFVDPTVRAGLLFFNGLREVDLRAPGFGHHIPALLASRARAQMCRGGSAALARALLRAVEARDGRVRTGESPRRILVEDGRAVGVETAAGRRVRARRFVASSLNPHQTLIDLLPAAALPPAWRARARAFRYNLLAPLFGLYLNLEEPPRYRAAEGRPHLDRAFMVILGLEEDGQFDEIVGHHRAGTVPPTVMWGSCPTLFDPGQAPPGRHTAFMWEKLPYALGGDPASWDAAGAAHGEAMLRLWGEYAPNIAGAALSRFVRSPLDVERNLANMRHGDLLVGSLGHGQVGYGRPFAGAGQYRTCIEGLYLCGSSCHPSGNITGLPGYNCAQVLAGDLGVRRPGG